MYSFAFAQELSQVQVDLLPIEGLGHRVTHCLAGAEYPKVLPGHVLTQVFEAVTYHRGDAQLRQSVAAAPEQVAQELSQASQVRVPSFLN